MDPRFAEIGPGCGCPTAIPIPDLPELESGIAGKLLYY
jgi:hypothetical protein